MSAAPQHTYVQYFVPGDGDSEEHPNVCLVRRAPGALRLEDVAAAFPLPGTYFFRAKQPLGKAHSEQRRSRSRGARASEPRAAPARASRALTVPHARARCSLSLSLSRAPS